MNKFVRNGFANLFLLAFGLTTAPICALECGKDFWTKDCLGETDIRYDPDYTINIADQSSVWAKREGFYVVTEYSYGPDYQLVENFTAGDPSLSYKYGPDTVFRNVTFDGSRAYYNALAIFEHTDPDSPGGVFPSDNYGVSSFEKDGSIITLPWTSLNLATGAATDKTGISYPIEVGGGTAYTLRHARSALTGSETIVYQTHTCLDNDCDTAIYARQIVDVDQGKLESFSAGTQKRVTEEEWISKINQAYIDAKVPEGLRREVPMTKSCFQNCATEEDFCKAGDPSCNESPYKEPDGSFTTGAIVVISVLAFVVTAVLVFVILRFMANSQEKRYRTKFATRVAQTIDLQKSMKSLTPSVLAKEFAKIDESNNGRISKENLWNFLNSDGGDGDDEIRRHDFNALWAALDTHGTGQVDFLEFCAFFSECQDEYNEARRKNPTNRASIRQSLAASMSLKYAEVSKAIEPLEEEPGANDNFEED